MKKTKSMDSTSRSLQITEDILPKFRFSEKATKI